MSSTRPSAPTPARTESTTLARFTSAASVQKYLEDRVDSDGFRELVWTHDGQPRGLTAISPSTGTGHATIATTFCGLPTYLVQITAPDRKKTSTLTLYNDIWNKAVFPDVNPPQCGPSFTSPVAGAQVTASTHHRQGRRVADQFGDHQRSSPRATAPRPSSR